MTNNKQMYEQNLEILNNFLKTKTDIIGIDPGTHITGFYSKKTEGR
jgi:hypothetical protein